MTIETNRPEIEALIRERLDSGAFESVADLVTGSEKRAWQSPAGFRANWWTPSRAWPDARATRILPTVRPVRMLPCYL